MVQANRAALQRQCPGLEQIQWLNQVHGTAVVESGTGGVLEADACYTREPGLACAIMTADCLPLLFCDRSGQHVAAAHAGWRGLLAGVIENTVAHISGQGAGHNSEQLVSDSIGSELLVWMGPAISQHHFEVGAEVRRAFVAAASSSEQPATESAFRAGDRPGHYFADLYQLARIRLAALGITQVYGGDFCSYAEKERFFSYRRDGETGRMATLIYRVP